MATLLRLGFATAALRRIGVPSCSFVVKTSCMKSSRSLTDTLCTRCGLCCDGSLFADVELAGRAEAVGLELLGLQIEEDDGDGGLLLQPCAALQGKRCGIYAHRPGCCRTFECRLLQDVRRGAVSVERAGEHIAEALRRTARVRALATALGQRDNKLPLKERCAEALMLSPAVAGADGGGATAGRERERKRAKLEREMAAVEGLMEERFLGEDV